MRSQAGPPIAADPAWSDLACLLLKLTITLHAPLGEPKEFRNGLCTVAGLPCRDHAQAQIFAVWFHGQLPSAIFQHASN